MNDYWIFRITRLALLFVGGFEVMAFLGCRSDIRLASNEIFITRSTLGEKWPFIVENGVLSCDANPLAPALAAVTFESGNVTYGLNGGALNGNAFSDVDGIMKKTRLGLYQVSLGDLIVQGLELCKNLDKDHRPVI